MVVSTRRAGTGSGGKLRKSLSASKLIGSLVKPSSKPALPPKPTRAKVPLTKPIVSEPEKKLSVSEDAKKPSKFKATKRLISSQVLKKSMLQETTKKSVQSEMIKKPDPPKVAPKPERRVRPVMAPKPGAKRSPTRRRNSRSTLVTTGKNTRTLISPLKSSSSPDLPKPAKTPGWSSPCEEAFRIPVPSQNRRTSVYRKRLFHSLLDDDQPVSFSPAKTRRQSVYGIPSVRSPPKSSARRQSLVPRVTISRLPPPSKTPVSDPFISREPEPSQPEPTPVAQAKKRRPVCGVAALRRQSLLPDPSPVKLSDETDLQSREELGEKSIDTSVEIIDMRTPLRSGVADEMDFFTPSGQDLLDASVYETPALNKVRGTPAVRPTPTPSNRLPQSVTSRKRGKTPRRTGRGLSRSANFEIIPLTEDVLNQTSSQNQTLSQTICELNGDDPDSMDKDDSSRCTVS